MGQKQKGASPKIGRAKRPGPAGRRNRYATITGPSHKLKQMLLHNGYAAAMEWALARSHMPTLQAVINKSTSTHVARAVAKGRAASGPTKAR